METRGNKRPKDTAYPKDCGRETLGSTDQIEIRNNVESIADRTQDRNITGTTQQPPIAGTVLTDSLQSSYKEKLKRC